MHKRELGIPLILVLVLIIVRLPGIFFQAPHQDEYFTLLEVAGNWDPDWPDEIAPAGQSASLLKESTTLDEVTTNLRTSVHPPLYYWVLSLWRRAFGYSIETARGLSLVFSVGAALSFYGLLRAGKLKYPWIPALVYGLSTQAVFWGQNARDYAFASFFVLSTAYFAYRSVQVSLNELGGRMGIFDAAMMMCAGLAFASNYFALFSTSVVLLWYGIYIWKLNKWRVLRGFGFPLLMHILLLPLLRSQYAAQGGSQSGFLGFPKQIMEMAKANYSVLYSPFFRSVPFMLLVWAIFSAFIFWSLFVIARRWQFLNHKLFLLLAGMTLSPTLSIILVNFLFDKNLTHYRYLLMVGPGLALALCYGLVLLLSRKQKLAILLLGLVVVLQMTGINWGIEKMPRFKGSHYRTLAEMINASDGMVVLMGSRVGRGHPAVLFDELDPDTPVLKLNDGHDPAFLLEQSRRYAVIWFVPATERGTGQIDQAFLNLLRSQGAYQETEVIVGEEAHKLESRWFERVLRFQKQE